MDPNVDVPQEDLQEVYNKHALYHLTQLIGKPGRGEPDPELKTDLKERLQTTGDKETHPQDINDKPLQYKVSNLDDTASKTTSFDKHKSHELHSFGDESSSFFLSNERSSSIHFVEDPTFSNDLVDVGLSEKHLSQLAGGPNIPDTAQNSFEIQAGPLDEIHAGCLTKYEIQTKSAAIHPVELKKCVIDSDNLVTVPKITKGKVVDLLDISSISEIKRLWEKSSNGCEKSRNTSNNKNARKASSEWKTSSKRRKSVVETSTRISKANNIEISKAATSKQISSPTDSLKTCHIMLEKVENMNFEGTSLKVDLSLPIPTKENVMKTKSVKKLSRRTIEKVTKSVAKTQGLKSSKAIQSVIQFVTDSIEMVNKQNKQTSNTCKSADKIKQDVETEKSQFDDNSTPQATVGDAAASEIHQDYFSDDNFDAAEDSSDDYFPSEDEYKPSKEKKTVKKIKMKDSLKKFTLKKSQLKIESGSTQTGKDSGVSTKAKKKSYRKLGTHRIGRPPVFGHFMCKRCPFTANEKNLVDKHAKIHIRQELKCEYCDAKFKSENVLLEHQARKHTNENPFKCSVEDCEYASKCRTDLLKHQAKHAKVKTHICHLCGWATKWRRNLSSHHLMKHTEDRKFKCTECSFTAKRGIDLKQHMYRHTSEKPIECLVCRFTVKTNWELKSHMLVHSTEKPFKCTFPGCKAGTKTRTDLNKHMRVHVTERNFICKICSKGYKCQASLNKHYKYIHVDTKRFVCDTCGYKFKNKGALKKHLNVHTGIKPFKCSVCDMSFSIGNNLRTHMVTHDTQNRPFHCPLCPYGAREQDHLLAHIGTFHGKSYAYFCEICKKPFNRYSRLRVHYKRMHSQKEIDSLENGGELDLALLKMEMELDLEQASEKERKKSRKSRSRSIQSDCQDAQIKEEPVDHVMDDNNTGIEAGKVKDLRLNEATGEIEVVSKSEMNQSFMVSRNSTTSEHSVKTIDSDVETEYSLDTEIEQFETRMLNARNNCTSQEVIEEPSVLLNESTDNKEKILENSTKSSSTEDDRKKSQSLKIHSNSTATLAMYNGFRLPLARKGFEFNYEKTGKKPNAWFMDVSCMNKKASEKQKAYLRRVGLMKPLPRGKRKKNTLTAFVKERRKKLTESVRKSNLLKESRSGPKKVNAKRSARFKGKYNFEVQFENLDGEELSVNEVGERLVQSHENVTSMSSESRKKIVKAKGDSKSRTKSKSSPSADLQQQKKNNISKKKTNKPKLLLSSEKKSKSKISNKQIKIRKPKFIQSIRIQTEDKPVSQEAVKSSKTAKQGVKSSKISKSRLFDQPTETKCTSSTKKRKASSSQEKPRYNKKYVPVKKLKTNESSSPKKKKENSVKCTGNGRKSSKPNSSSLRSPKKMLKVKFTGSFDKQQAKPIQQNIVDSGVTPNTGEIEHVTFPSTFNTSYHPPVELTLTNAEAALMNKQGMALDRVVILKTETIAMESNDCGNIIGNTEQTSSSPYTNKEIGVLGHGYHNGPSVSTKGTSSDADTKEFVVVEAETGIVKEAVLLNSDDKMDKGFNSVVKVKQEHKDDIGEVMNVLHKGAFE